MMTFEAYIAEVVFLNSRGYVISCEVNHGKVNIGDDLNVVPKAGEPLETKVIGIALGGRQRIDSRLIDLVVSLPEELTTELTGATVRILKEA